MASSAPIGIFDSGLGGLSVVRSVHALLPHEDILYFGDSAHAPYGTKAPEEVRELSLDIARNFVDRGAKAIVIACNTATSVCVNDLRRRYPIPVIGMEPALKLACDRGQGRPQRIIVAATELTLKEQKFARLMDRFKSTHTIWPQPCPDLVEIVESGRLDEGDLVRSTISRYLSPYNLDQVDSIVLGCTHFVFFRDYFRSICPGNVAILDGNGGTARHLADRLTDSDQLNGSQEEGVIEIGNSDPSPAMIAYSKRLLDRP
ncbi:glutamate racemase [Bifidobacterium favimelis]|uniref:Glutamate racemase n=1 Tax=Bifidobacterium favimelis TaxID=3122979 RepID=A0ABU8ZPM1_9BIFI